MLTSALVLDFLGSRPRVAAHGIDVGTCQSKSALSTAVGAVKNAIFTSVMRSISKGARICVQRTKPESRCGCRMCSGCRAVRRPLHSTTFNQKYTAA
ncbi:hypothetical protein IWX46DRAFT_605859 [Phyllosticta citricarpa]|uniref:Secreted protein n=1 Tax=Phyllosticta citricarpa TaxID=55181 RepID=A0ABR1M1J1_9PEZI